MEWGVDLAYDDPIYALSRLSKKCKECPYVKWCQNKEMEHLGYLKPTNIEAGVNVTAPVLRETMIINSNGTNCLVYKDEIEEQLYKSLRGPFLNGLC